MPQNNISPPGPPQVAQAALGSGGATALPGGPPGAPAAPQAAPAGAPAGNPRFLAYIAAALGGGGAAMTQQQRRRSTGMYHPVRCPGS
jgi:hypothetical protein